MFCGASCDGVAPPVGWSTKKMDGWNEDAIRQTLQEKITQQLDRAAGSVIIGKNSSGTITFDGIGLPGRTVDMDTTVRMTIQALKEDIDRILLPVIEIQPSITVTDAELAASGIKEVVTVGESDFSGSTKGRKHNIRTGLLKFNGHLIPKDTVFSFNEVLGPVTAAAGYLKELVIQGDRTVPDYGGGLCQVGSTSYRGVWEYGFPITQRKNHSYMVHYYSPQGTDATIYPPNVDMKFLNDSPGALLIQTAMVEEENHAYFIYYGTKDARTTEIFGPYTWSQTAAPTEKRIEYTTDIPPGTQKKLGERVPGMSVSWFRSVVMPSATGSIITETYSVYQARPLFYQVGVTAEELPALIGTGSVVPTSDATMDVNS